MSFIRRYGGNQETMAHSGMAAVQRAIDAGMTVHQIQAQAGREGISFGHKAQDYLNARQGTFIGKYGGNEGTMAHAGLQAVDAASAAGLSYEEMQRQAAAEGVQFQSGAQALFKSYRDAAEQQKRREQEMKSLQSRFDSQMASIRTQMASQQSAYDKNLKSMENTMKATMNPNNRESVLGIKGASTGSASDSAAMARQGVKGTFSRSGLRIKKIKDKAVNVT